MTFVNNKTNIRMQGYFQKIDRNLHIVMYGSLKMIDYEVLNYLK